MNGARRLLILGGIALALWGMGYGLWYAVFAEHQALNGIGSSLAAAFDASASRNPGAREAAFGKYKQAKYVYDRQVDVHSHWIGLAMLICQKGWLTGLRRRLGAVGRMAFTNYLTHTFVCTFLFYGWGLGLFGKLSRVQQFGVVLVIWAFQLIVSPWWLDRFQFGPFEWIWRSLTYWKPQPMRKTVSAPAISAPAEA